MTTSSGNGAAIESSGTVVTYFNERSHPIVVLVHRDGTKVRITSNGQEN